MTTIDLEDRAALSRPETPALAGLRIWLERLRKRREQRLTLEHLSRMDPYLLRDMGLEIDDVEEALRAGPHSVLLEPMHR